MAAIRKRLTYANVVSSIALFFVLGGGAYAATRIGSRQIRDNSIASRDIKDGTIALSDLNRATIRALRGLPGAPGAPGLPGAMGAPGLPGLPGLFGYEIVVDAEMVHPTDQGSHSFEARCPAGKKLLGGGVATFNPNIAIGASSPTSDGGNTWAVEVHPLNGATFGGGGDAVTIRIACANVGR